MPLRIPLSLDDLGHDAGAHRAAALAPNRDVAERVVHPAPGLGERLRIFERICEPVAFAQDGTLSGGPSVAEDSSLPDPGGTGISLLSASA